MVPEGYTVVTAVIPNHSTVWTLESKELKSSNCRALGYTENIKNLVSPVHWLVTDQSILPDGLVLNQFHRVPSCISNTNRHLDHKSLLYRAYWIEFIEQSLLEVGLLEIESYFTNSLNVLLLLEQLPCTFCGFATQCDEHGKCTNAKTMV